MARVIFACLFVVSLGFAGCADASTLRTRGEVEWLQELQQQAIESGISPSVVHEALDTFEPNARVMELDQKQPETTITFRTYRRNTLSPARVRKGAELMRRYEADLAEIERQTGVPPQIVMALWGIESSFGQNMGDYEVVNSLATLAYEGRRAEFFRAELFAALRILERENMTPSEMRGSWAGAMGQCQFMPSIYLRYAVDADGDGRRDIWNDPYDSMASIANYLAAEGWKRELTWGREVVGNEVGIENVGLTKTRTLHEWARMGVTNADGSALPQRELRASFLRPDGEDGPAFLVYDNVRALMRWNHSSYFALSVGLLAEEIRAN